MQETVWDAAENRESRPRPEGTNKSHTAQNPCWKWIDYLPASQSRTRTISRKFAFAKQIGLPWPLPPMDCVEKEGERDHISPLWHVSPSRNGDGSPTGQFTPSLWRWKMQRGWRRGKSQSRNWVGMEGRFPPTGFSHSLPLSLPAARLPLKRKQWHQVMWAECRVETELFVCIKPVARSINFRPVKQISLKQKTFHWISAFPTYTNNTRGDKQYPSISIFLPPDPNRTWHSSAQLLK